MTREDCNNAIKVIKNYDLNNSKVNSLLFSAEEIANAFDCALEALEQEPQTFEWCHDCSEYDHDKHCCPRYNKVIRNTVEEIKQSKMGQWIPISEKLPEKEGLYLVSVKNDHERRYSKTCWFHGNGNWFARQDVIAYMPLPEPYEPQESEE